MKTCRMCRVPKPEDQFYWSDSAKTIRASYCKACAVKRCSRNRMSKPVSWRQNITLKNAYGITLAEKQKMISDQGAKCAICGTPFGNGVRACVDHDHKTKKVRAILCQHCNIGIGNFFENTVLLEKAIAYIKNVCVH